MGVNVGATGPNTPNAGGGGGGGSGSTVTSLYRRRRTLWSLFVLAFFSLLYLATRHSLPFSLTDPFPRSRVTMVDNVVSNERRLRVQEIHALLHFVTEHTDRRLNEQDDGSIHVVGVGDVNVDPNADVDFRVYAPDGDDDWQKHLSILREEHPLVVFSKTYCPYSLRAKHLLESYELSPPPTIVELDTRSDGAIIQRILGRLTGRTTVPNVLLQANSIGGSDDIHELHEHDQLRELLQEAGIRVQAFAA